VLPEVAKLRPAALQLYRIAERSQVVRNSLHLRIVSIPGKPLKNWNVTDSPETQTSGGNMESLISLSNALRQLREASGNSLSIRRLRILLALKQTPMATMSDLMVATGVRKSTLWDTLQGFSAHREDGKAPLVAVMSSEDPGGTIRYSLTARGDEVIDNFGRTLMGCRDE